jgi:hypothetical protein
LFDFVPFWTLWDALQHSSLSKNSLLKMISLSMDLLYLAGIDTDTVHLDSFETKRTISLIIQRYKGSRTPISFF